MYVLFFYYKCSTRKDWIITQDLVRCSADTEDVSSSSCDLLYVPLGRRRAAERSMSGMVSCFIANQIGTWPSGDFMYVYLISCVRLPFWMSPSIMSVTSRSAFTTEWWPKGKTKNATDAKGKKSHQTVVLHNSHNSYCHQRFNHSLLFFCFSFSPSLCRRSFFSASTSIQLNYNNGIRQQASKANLENEREKSQTKPKIIKGQSHEPYLKSRHQGDWVT